MERFKSQGQTQRFVATYGAIYNNFKIERPASGHVGFGFGIHQCLGQMVARLEGELIAAEFARQAKSIDLAGEPVRRINNTLWAIAGLPVQVEAA